MPLGEAVTLAIPVETKGTVCLAPRFLSRSVTFLVNQSFGVCCLLARFRYAKYSNAAMKGGGVAAEAFSCTHGI